MKKFPVLLVLVLLVVLTAPAFADSDSTIPFPADYDTTSSGASAYQNSGDHTDSIYFAHPDYYNMTSTDTLTILTNFKTYQQTTEYTCGPASVLMVLNYFGETGYTEMEIAEIAGCQEGTGSTPQGLTTFFESIGWEVTNNLSDGSENGEEEFDSETFAAWVIENLSEGTPIIVDWIDWDGHFQVIIGYDTMGTDSVGDDVLIVADPYDTSDHLQDGYYTLGAERFFYMWHEGFSADGDDIQVQPYVLARPAAAE